MAVAAASFVCTDTGDSRGSYRFRWGGVRRRCGIPESSGRRSFAHRTHVAPRFAAVLGELHFPRRAVHAGGEDVGHDDVRPQIVFVGGVRPREDGVAVIEAYLMIVGTLRGLEIGVDDLRSVDLVDHEAVGVPSPPQFERQK